MGDWLIVAGACVLVLCWWATWTWRIPRHTPSAVIAMRVASAGALELERWAAGWRQDPTVEIHQINRRLRIEGHGHDITVLVVKKTPPSA
jgi:hypothetical protein